MNLDEVKFKFEERFYLWSRETLNRELSDGFPLLTSVKAKFAKCYLRVLEQLNEHQVRPTANALLKRWRRKEVLDKWGAPFTQEDQEYVDLWLRMMDIEDHKDAMQRSSLEYTQKRKFNRRIFRKYIKTTLEPILGNSYENWGGGEWRYYTLIGPWKVATHIDTGGKYRELFYYHTIQISDSLRLYEFISLFLSLGIASQTYWQDLKDEDAESTAQSFAKIIKYFLDAAPKLLDGLTLDE